MVLFAYGLDPDRVEEGEILGKITRYSFPCIVAGLLLIIGGRLNKNNPSFALWHLISVMQVVRWISIIDVEQPNIYDAFFEEVSKSIDQSEIVPLDSGSSVSSRFRNFGIESNRFLNNAEEYLIIWFASLLFYLIVICLSKNSENFTRVKEKVKFNLLLRATLVCYMDFMVYGFIQTQNLSFEGVFNALSSIFGVSAVFLGIGFVFFVPISLKIVYDKYEITRERAVVMPISSFTEEFSIEVQYQYYTLFILVRFVIAFSVSLLDSPAVQLILAGLMELVMLIYLLKIWPFKRRGENILVFVSELCVFLLIIINGLFYLEAVSGDSAAWVSYTCIFLLWIAEFACLIRFLNIVNNKSFISNFVIKPSEFSINMDVSESRSDIESDYMDKKSTHKRNLTTPDDTTIDLSNSRIRSSESIRENNLMDRSGKGMKKKWMASKELEPIEESKFEVEAILSPSDQMQRGNTHFYYEIDTTNNPMDRLGLTDRKSERPALTNTINNDKKPARKNNESATKASNKNIRDPKQTKSDKMLYQKSKTVTKLKNSESSPKKYASEKKLNKDLDDRAKNILEKYKHSEKREENPPNTGEEETQVRGKTEIISISLGPEVADFPYPISENEIEHDDLEISSSKIEENPIDNKSSRNLSSKEPTQSKGNHKLKSKEENRKQIERSKSNERSNNYVKNLKTPKTREEKQNVHSSPSKINSERDSPDPKESLQNSSKKLYSIKETHEENKNNRQNSVERANISKKKSSKILNTEKNSSKTQGKSSEKIEKETNSSQNNKFTDTKTQSDRFIKQPIDNEVKTKRKKLTDEDKKHEKKTGEDKKYEEKTGEEKKSKKKIGENESEESLKDLRKKTMKIEQEMNKKTKLQDPNPTESKSSLDKTETQEKLNTKRLQTHSKKSSIKQDKSSPENDYGIINHNKFSYPKKEQFNSNLSERQEESHKRSRSIPISTGKKIVKSTKNAKANSPQKNLISSSFDESSNTDRSIIPRNPSSKIRIAKKSEDSMANLSKLLQKFDSRYRDQVQISERSEVSKSFDSLNSNKTSKDNVKGKKKNEYRDTRTRAKSIERRNNEHFLSNEYISNSFGTSNDQEGNKLSRLRKNGKKIEDDPRILDLEARKQDLFSRIEQFTNNISNKQ